MPRAASLNSNDVFIVDTEKDLFLWIGRVSYLFPFLSPCGESTAKAEITPSHWEFRINSRPEYSLECFTYRTTQTRLFASLDFHLSLFNIKATYEHEQWIRLLSATRSIVFGPDVAVALDWELIIKSQSVNPYSHADIHMHSSTHRW